MNWLVEIFLRDSTAHAVLVLALVIGPMMENALRQSLMLSLGSFDIFFTQPLSRALFLLAGLILVSPFLWRLTRQFFIKKGT